MDTATVTVNKEMEVEKQLENIKKFAATIATACIAKLKLDKGYFTTIRVYGAPCPMHFVEIGVTPNVKPVETHEFSVIMPASAFLAPTKEERSALAQHIFKNIALGVAKWEAK